MVSFQLQRVFLGGLKADLSNPWISPQKGVRWLMTPTESHGIVPRRTPSHSASTPAPHPTASIPFVLQPLLLLLPAHSQRWSSNPAPLKFKPRSNPTKATERTKTQPQTPNPPHNPTRCCFLHCSQATGAATATGKYNRDWSISLAGWRRTLKNKLKPTKTASVLAERGPCSLSNQEPPSETALRPPNNLNRSPQPQEPGLTT